jgi:hypothetical protein
MLDIPALQQYRLQRFFKNWDGYVEAKTVESAESVIRS